MRGLLSSDAGRNGLRLDLIRELAAEQKSDLIVMGVHGRGAVDVAVFGSNSARVIRGAVCPVLIVPRHEDKR
jgi:nucleotide-binding universal stress UspA family protein